jgi:hypothetical protein
MNPYIRRSYVMLDQEMQLSEIQEQCRRYKLQNDRLRRALSLLAKRCAVNNTMYALNKEWVGR